METSKAYKWREQIDKLAHAAGLNAVPADKMSVDNLQAGNVHVWAGTYAMLVVWAVSEDELGAISSSWIRMQDCLDRVLLKEEEDGKGTFDGYFCLMLPRQPDESELSHLRHIETDRSVCRKHVLWPGKHGTGALEDLVHEITALALPPSELASDAAQLKNVDTWERDFINKIDAELSGKTLADQYLKEIGLAEEDDETA